MELAPIHFDHEAVSEKEVDATDSGNPNLPAWAERLHPQPEERLDAGLADPVGCAQRATVARGLSVGEGFQLRAHFGDGLMGDRSEEGIRCRRDQVRRGTTAESREGGEVIGEQSGPAAGVVPVHRDGVGVLQAATRRVGGAESARVSCHSDVEVLVIVNPHATTRECRGAGEAAPDSCRTGENGIERHTRVPTLPHPLDASARQVAVDVDTADPIELEFVRGSEPAMGVDGLEGVAHGSEHRAPRAQRGLTSRNRWMPVPDWYE